MRRVRGRGDDWSGMLREWDFLHSRGGGFVILF